VIRVIRSIEPGATVLAATSGGRPERTVTASTTPGAEVPERPALAPGVELVGEMQDTGFAERQWLIQRDGRFLQVTELLYRVAERIDGNRTLEEIATAITASTEWIVTADNVRQLIGKKLSPMGLILGADGAAARRTQVRERSPLQINLRLKALSPRLIEPVTAVFQYLYAPPVLASVLVLAGLAYSWLYLVRGVADGVHAALYTPGGLLVVLGLALASALVHEFGHAAALRYGGGKVRGIGVGLYLAYPTFYTDTTDAYRLSRWARLRTDLGGIYFHLLFGVALIVVYLVTGQEILLAVVVVITGDILYQLTPFVRLDGYWALADLTGVPDPLSQASPFLRGTLPLSHSAGSRLPALKRWARVAFITYIALTIPALVVITFLMIWGFPRYMAFGWDALLFQARMLSLAWSSNDTVLSAAVIAQMALLALSMLAIVYFLYSLFRKAVRTLWGWSRQTPARRWAGGLAAVVTSAVVIILWSPDLTLAHRPLPSGVKTFEIRERRHVLTPVSYAQSPPVGGNHHPVWQNCGFYDAPIANENGVHSLEHGAVWITYRPGLPPQQLDVLRRLARARSYVLVSPYLGLSAPVVASAWGRQVRLSSAFDPLLGQFIRAFRLGPQTPETGAPCTNGTGKPE
jgi:putative peptide zinc metalloprotease protein